MIAHNSTFTLAVQCGSGVISRREVKVRKHHLCEHCGRSIECNEYATLTVTYESGTIRHSYSCCERPFN